MTYTSKTDDGYEMTMFNVVGRKEVFTLMIGKPGQGTFFKSGINYSKHEGLAITKIIGRSSVNTAEQQGVSRDKLVELIRKAILETGKKMAEGK